MAKDSQADSKKARKAKSNGNISFASDKADNGSRNSKKQSGNRKKANDDKWGLTLLNYPASEASRVKSKPSKLSIDNRQFFIDLNAVFMYNESIRTEEWKCIVRIVKLNIVKDLLIVRIVAIDLFQHYQKTIRIYISETVIIKDGRLVLGTCQSIYFCEFDGSRNRKIYVKVKRDEQWTHLQYES